MSAASPQTLNNSYRVTIGSDTFEVVPNGGDWEVQIGDVTLSVANGAITIAPIEGVSEVSISRGRVRELDRMTDQPIFGESKKCIICDGKRYCAKNGCIKTPCGWLCG